MNTPGTPERPLCVAVIGSGPSGFYATEELLKASSLTVRLDLFDRLPTPFGLVHARRGHVDGLVHDRSFCPCGWHDERLTRFIETGDQEGRPLATHHSCKYRWLHAPATKV
jgi:hypothetical protein